MIKVYTNWSESVFKKVGIKNPREIFRLLDKLPEPEFTDNNLLPKETFITNLISVIQSIELTGDAMREAREMLSPGSIGENWFPGEFGYLRQSYIKERKKLRKQLELIKILFQ